MWVKIDFAALAVIDRSAGEIPANRNAHDDGRLESASGAPAQRGEFVAELHHGRPDVVEELNFGDRLQPANGHADRATDDGRFGERRIENARLP